MGGAMGEDDLGGPMWSREALLFEDTAGCTVMAALAQLRAGELGVRPAAAAILVVARRRSADVSIRDVYDTHDRFAGLIAAGTAALEALLADGEG
jgi:hypothetical protein